MSRIARAAAALLLCVLILVTGCANSVPGQALPADAPATGAPPGTAPLTDTGGTPEASRLDVEVLEQGFTTWNQENQGLVISYGAVLRNPNVDTWATTQVDVTVTFSDSAGGVVAVDDTPAVFMMLPGAEAAVVSGFGLGSDTGADATSMQVDIGETDWEETSDLTPGEVTFGPATTRPGAARPDRPGLLIDCEATSTFASVVQGGSINTVYRDPSGTIIGGSRHTFDSAAEAIVYPGGSTTPIEVFDYYPPPPSVPAAECYPNLVAER